MNFLLFMKNVLIKSRENLSIKTNELVLFFFFLFFFIDFSSFSQQPQVTLNDGASSSQHYASTSNPSSRPTDVADSVVPQGAVRVKTEPRQNQPPLPPSRPAQPPLPPSSQSSAVGIKREPTAAPTFSSSSNRPPIPSRPSSSSASFQHPSSSHYQTHHHVNNNNNNYNQHSRYPPQQARPGPPPPNRSSQQPPLPPLQHSKYFILSS
jgi:hypothetical protein